MTARASSPAWSSSEILLPHSHLKTACLERQSSSKPRMTNFSSHSHSRIMCSDSGYGFTGTLLICVLVSLQAGAASHTAAPQKRHPALLAQVPCYQHVIELLSGCDVTPP